MQRRGFSSLYRTKIVGLTLVEIMVAAVVISVAVLGVVGGFRTLSKGFSKTRWQSVATTVADNQVARHLNMPLKLLPPTVSASPVPGISPTVLYDPVLYPEDSVHAGGYRFRVFRYVDMVSIGSDGVATVMPPAADETFTRRVTIAVVYFDGSRSRIMQRTAIVDRPLSGMLGMSKPVEFIVTSTAGVPVPAARISVTSVSTVNGTTNQSGRITIAVNSYTFRVWLRHHSYDTVDQEVVISATETAPVRTFQMTALTFASVEGNVWKNEKLVISQVAGSTVNALTGFSQEYVEVFNPTTWTWAVSGAVSLRYGAAGLPLPIDTVYTATGIPPGGFYLFANTTPVGGGGPSRAAGAGWGPGAVNLLNHPDFGTQSNVVRVAGETADQGAGALELVSGATVLDRFGWEGAVSPAVSDAAPFPATAGLGLEAGEAYRRFSSTGGVSDSIGPAYDADNNAVNWAAAVPSPRNGASPLQPVSAGVPADGAWVKVLADRHSLPVQASVSGTAPLSRARFVIPQARPGLVQIAGFNNRARGSADGVVGSTVPVNIQLDTGGSLTILDGVITNGGIPLPGILVVSYSYILSTNTSTTDASVTDAAGRFRIIGNAPGHTFHYVNSSAVGGFPFDPNYSVNNITTFGVTAGSVTAVATYDLPRRIPSLVRVYEEGTTGPLGDPDVSYSIRAVDGSGVTHSFSVDADDTLYQNTLVPGNFTLLMEVNFSPEYFLHPASMTFTVPNLPVGQELMITTATVKRRLTAVRGTATTGGASAGPGILVTAIPASYAVLAVGAPPPPKPFPVTYYMAVTKDDGTYEFTLAPGPYNFYAWNWTESAGAVTSSRMDVLGVNVATNTVQTVNFPW